MLKKIILLTCILPFFVVTQEAHAFTKEEKQELTDKARVWAFIATQKLFHLTPEHFEAQLTQNEAVTTETGCAKYRWIIKRYGFDETVLKHNKEVRVVKLWKDKVTLRDLDLIKMRTLRHKKDYKGPKQIRWRARVPVILEYKRGIIKRNYRFYAKMDILLVNPDAGEFVITNMIPVNDKIQSAFQIVDYAEKIIPEKNDDEFDRDDYEECNGIPERVYYTE